MQTPHDSRMCPVDFEVERSKVKVTMHKLLKMVSGTQLLSPFTSIIMKLHMQTPHESRMCPVDFEVKRSKVKVTMHELLKWFPAHNYFLFTPIIMKLHIQTPHDSRMCLEKLSLRGVFVPLGQPRSRLS